MPNFSSLLAALHALIPRTQGARRSQRFPVSAFARIRASDTPDGAWEKVRLDNLSLGGAFVHTTIPLPPKTKIDLVVSLDGAVDIELRARVIYARNNGTAQSNCGLRFIDLSYDRYRALIAFVNDREKALTIGAQRPRRSRLA